MYLQVIVNAFLVLHMNLNVVHIIINTCFSCRVFCCLTSSTKWAHAHTHMCIIRGRAQNLPLGYEGYTRKQQQQRNMPISKQTSTRKPKQTETKTKTWAVYYFLFLALRVCVVVMSCGTVLSVRLMKMLLFLFFVATIHVCCTNNVQTTKILCQSSTLRREGGSLWNDSAEPTRRTALPDRRQCRKRATPVQCTSERDN